MNLLIALLAAHVCGDVLSYSPARAKAKRSETVISRIGAIGLHCLAHALLVIIWGWLLDVDGVYVAAFCILIIHFGIDLGRVQLEPRLFNPNDFVIINKNELVSWLLRRNTGNSELAAFMRKYFWKWIGVNVLDQSLHVGSILLVVVVLGGST